MIGFLLMGRSKAFCRKMRICARLFTKHSNDLNEFDSSFQAPTPQNGQTHSNNSLAKADKLYECVWPFCGFDT